MKRKPKNKTKRKTMMTSFDRERKCHRMKKKSKNKTKRKTMMTPFDGEVGAKNKWNEKGYKRMGKTKWRREKKKKRGGT